MKDSIKPIHDTETFFLNDPLTRELYISISNVSPLTAIGLDITHACNLRCKGCFFFRDQLDKIKSPKQEEEFDAFIEREKLRGTNFISVQGGEPALELDRLKKLHDNFSILTFTNGFIKIPYKNFEKMTISLALWGDHESDKMLRGSNKIDVFAEALKNYEGDPRVIWYYTTAPERWREIDSVTKQCIGNGNFLLFNYYDQIQSGFDHRNGYAKVRHEIDKMIDKFPDRIITTSYINKITTNNMLYDQGWCHEVCPTISFENINNLERIANGYPYIRHFRALMPDWKTVRRCCTGENNDCKSCYNVWPRITWIVVNKQLHLGSGKSYFEWLSTKYSMYLFAGVIPLADSIHLLPQIHRRLKNSNSQHIKKDVESVNTSPVGELFICEN